MKGWQTLATMLSFVSCDCLTFTNTFGELIKQLIMNCLKSVVSNCGFKVSQNCPWLQFSQLLGVRSWANLASTQTLGFLSEMGVCVVIVRTRRDLGCT